jgi:hypothetical protein
MDKVTRTTPKSDESETLAEQLDMMTNAMDGNIDRDVFRQLVDTRFIDQSLDRLKMIENLMKYKGSKPCHKKNTCKK